ncbi:hypothetical protein [Chryseobacterium sp. MMS23-Vi53]|uniref:hypothetical protein n=1 Tax=Chryseobacterium sp. MMS23-Vi53 TaxID=3386644 RepID=UPI0039EBFD75
MIITRILILFLSIFANFFYTQKIGIISDINPQMGYVVFKGEFFNEKPILEKDVDYNFIKFIENHFQSKNIQTEQFYSNHFTDYKMFYESKSAILDLKKICSENNFSKIILVLKNTQYIDVNDPMLIYENLNHELGFETHKKTPTRALLYGNFKIYVYDFSSNKLNLIINKVYIVHRFKQPLFDKNSFDLQNDEPQKKFSSELEQRFIEKFDKIK